MIIKHDRKSNRPYIWMVIDNRQELFNRFGPKGGWGELFLEYVKEKYGFVGKLLTVDGKQAEKDNLDMAFLDMKRKGGVWVGSFWAFKEKEKAEILNKEFGK